MQLRGRTPRRNSDHFGRTVGHENNRPDRFSVKWRSRRSSNPTSITTFLAAED